MVLQHASSILSFALSEILTPDKKQLLAQSKEKIILRDRADEDHLNDRGQIGARMIAIANC